jgi:hypothetical protein
MQSHLGSVVLCLISTCMVGFKVLRNYYAKCGESVQPLQSVKLINQLCSRSRAPWILTWLMNLKMDLICLQVISVALLSTNHKCIHPYLRCSEENPKHHRGRLEVQYCGYLRRYRDCTVVSTSPHIVIKLCLDFSFVLVSDPFISTSCFLGADGTGSAAFYFPRFRYIGSCAS